MYEYWLTQTICIYNVHNYAIITYYCLSKSPSAGSPMSIRRGTEQYLARKWYKTYGRERYITADNVIIAVWLCVKNIAYMLLK